MNGLRLHWIVFGLMLGCAAVFVTSSAAQLPPVVASHFDAAGNPNGFMAQRLYVRFMLILSIGVPIATVVLMNAVYSRAKDMKLPNREYWLDPVRIDSTRAMLKAHGVWFGSLLTGLVCFVHWLELDANHKQPPHLDPRLVFAGLLVFFAATAGWLAALVIALRRR